MVKCSIIEHVANEQISLFRRLSGFLSSCFFLKEPHLGVGALLPKHAMNVEKHISLLQVIKKNPDSGQRDLAEAVGLSLGMTNILLKELAAKGWVMIRKINSRNFNYLLTPDGVKELSKRSYRYLKKTIRNLADCRENLEKFVLGIKKQNYTEIRIIGESDLDFILEFLCQKFQIKFSSSIEETAYSKETFIIYSENVPAKNPNIIALLQTEKD